MSKTLAQAYLDVSMTLPIEDIKVKQRLDRAYEIINGYGYAITLRETNQYGVGIYDIHKASTTLLEDTSARYTVSRAVCTCPDYDTARGNLCKHRLAIMLMEDMAHGNE